MMANKQWHPDDLRKVFPEVPESCSRVLMDTAGSLREENDMKRFHTPRRSPRLAVVLALVIISMLGVALAALYPRIAESFGNHYGEDFQEWLEAGDVALPENSVVVDGVTFTLNEVAHRNRGLYGMITITPIRNIVLLSEDSAPTDAYGYAERYGDKAPDGAVTILEKAAQSSSDLKQVHLNLDQIGVDGGAMLQPNGYGYGEYPQRDGSIQLLFEVEDGQAVSEGKKYTIQMTAIVRSVSADGVVDYENPVRKEWTVEIEPKPFSEFTDASATVMNVPASTAAPALNNAEMQIIVPEAYTANGTLPVYKATARDFSKTMDYTLFNQSGVAEETLNTCHIGGTVDFNDGGHLDWGSYHLDYRTYDGAYEAVSKLEDGSTFTETLPKSTMVSDISNIAMWMVSGFPGVDEVYTLEKMQLAAISLAQAQAQAEGLMSKLGVSGYTCTTALDMGVDRIHEMGALYNAYIDSGAMCTNAYRYDYATATTAEEGYYLVYHKFGKDSLLAGQFQAAFYVTAYGIKVVNLNDAYEQGEIVRAPATLVDAQTVVDALPGEIADSRFVDEVKQIKRATLTWMPVRAEKGDGMVMTPVWVLSYITEEGDRQSFEDWAMFDAIDGTLINAIFN